MKSCAPSVVKNVYFNIEKKGKKYGKKIVVIVKVLNPDFTS